MMKRTMVDENYNEEDEAVIDFNGCAATLAA
jgi:hypothetical protein